VAGTKRNLRKELTSKGKTSYENPLRRSKNENKKKTGWQIKKIITKGRGGEGGGTGLTEKNYWWGGQETNKTG